MGFLKTPRYTRPLNLIATAVPFFLLAIAAEWLWGRVSGRDTYRLNDSISSLTLGGLSQARRFVALGIGGSVYAWLVTVTPFASWRLDGWMGWVLAFILYDLCYYWSHRAGHEIKLFWASHAVHHQSEDYNLSTALRQTSTGFLFGWIFYTPLFFIGVPGEMMVTVGALNLIYQFWVHTEHVGELGWFEYVFVSPSNHRVHHARNTCYLDRNYGGVFIVWDRILAPISGNRRLNPVSMASLSRSDPGHLGKRGCMFIETCCQTCGERRVGVKRYSCRFLIPRGRQAIWSMTRRLRL